MRNWLITFIPLLFCMVLLLVTNVPLGDHGIIFTFRKPHNLKIVKNPGIPKKTKALSDESDNQQSPIIYLVPHADDETLTYGIDILNSIRAGRQVQLVLLSESVFSTAFDMINGRNYKGERVYDRVFDRFHNPIKENYQNGYLTRAVFGAARLKEFEQASLELGVKTSNIAFINGLNAGDTSILIQKFLNAFPHAEFRTMAKEDSQPAHVLLGKVLQSFVDRHLMQPSQVRYIVSVYTDRFDKTLRERFGNQAYLSFKKKERTEYLTNPIDKKHLQTAINIYKKWDPANGWYAIGYHSVPEQFRSLEKEMYTRYYLAKAPV